MINPYSVIIGTIFTERSTALQENENKYTFKVSPKSTKVDIKNAVQKIFKVKVTSVNTVQVRGKLRRVRFKAGFTASWKKAIVTLNEGDSIDFA